MSYKIIVIDTETGGLDAEQKSILSLGAVILDNGSITDEFYTVIREDKIIYDAQALKVNGFTVSEIERDGVSPSEALDSFMSFLSRNNLANRATLAGHNVGFDIGFLKRLFRLAGREKVYDKCFSYRTVDTQSVAQLLQMAGRITVKSTSLDSLCAACGITIREGSDHNALEDARATAILFTGFLDMIRLPKAFPDAF